MSVEAGLERISKDDFNEPEITNDLDNEQYSMIIKNIDDDEADYAFVSQLDTPMQEEQEMSHPEENKLDDEEVMTVIEKD